jgi:O-acetyl-ADP-ribose deacetylase (regulator of RNase III)
VNTVKTFLANHSEIEEVVFVCFDEENYELIKNILDVQL